MTLLHSQAWNLAWHKPSGPHDSCILYTCKTVILRVMPPPNSDASSIYSLVPFDWRDFPTYCGKNAFLGNPAQARSPGNYPSTMQVSSNCQLDTYESPGKSVFMRSCLDRAGLWLRLWGYLDCYLRKEDSVHVGGISCAGP